MYEKKKNQTKPETCRCFARYWHCLLIKVWIDYREAIEIFREILHHKPDDAAAWNSLGLAYEKLDRYHEAINAYREALRFKPAYAWAVWYNLGIAYANSGNRSAALEAVKELRRYDPHKADELFNRIMGAGEGKRAASPDPSFKNRNLGYFFQARGPKNLFFDCGGQGCRIISEVRRMHMKKYIYFDATTLDQLGEEYVKVREKYERLLLKYLNLNLKNRTAAEYCTHGFLRRLATLKRCIENIFNISPAEKSDKLPNDDLLDLAINLQSFMFNVFGCLDNLAWIVLVKNNSKMKKIDRLRGTAVGLMSKEKNKNVIESFSQDFQDYLNASTKWYDEYLKEYRHALAHRIPLYIPPSCLNEKEFKQYESLEKRKVEARKQNNFQLVSQINEEQDRLGKFVPIMKHSFAENSRPVVFHAQILIDWNTIVDIAEKFLDEFPSTRNMPSGVLSQAGE